MYTRRRRNAVPGNLLATSSWWIGDEGDSGTIADSAGPKTRASLRTENVYYLGRNRIPVTTIIPQCRARAKSSRINYGHLVVGPHPNRYRRNITDTTPVPRFRRRRRRSRKSSCIKREVLILPLDRGQLIRPAQRV